MHPDAIKHFITEPSNYVGGWGFTSSKGIFIGKSGACHLRLQENFNGPTCKDASEFYTVSGNTPQPYGTAPPKAGLKDYLKWLATGETPWRQLGKPDPMRDASGDIWAYRFSNPEMFQDSEMQKLLYNFCIAARLARDHGHLFFTYDHLRNKGFDPLTSFIFSPYFSMSGKSMIRAGRWDGSHEPFVDSSNDPLSIKRLKSGDYMFERSTVGHSSSGWSGTGLLPINDQIYTAGRIKTKFSSIPSGNAKDFYATIEGIMSNV